jgi:hypothetical protein
MNVNDVLKKNVNFQMKNGGSPILKKNKEKKNV